VDFVRICKELWWKNGVEGWGDGEKSGENFAGNEKNGNFAAA